MNLNDITATASVSKTSYLTRLGGQIRNDVAGTGPLAVLVPGMGDPRAAYRFPALVLRAAGYRAACTDFRGHGDSDTVYSGQIDAWATTAGTSDITGPIPTGTRDA